LVNDLLINIYKKMKMKIFLYIAIIFASLLLFTCCKQNKKENEKNLTNQSANDGVNKERSLTRIDALYYNYILESETPIKASDMKKEIPVFSEDKNGILDASITDSTKIKEIKDLLNDLKASEEETTPDTRMIFVLVYDDESKDTISLAEIYSDRIYFNGREQIRNNKLLFTLKNYIGFYPWLIGDDMFNMSELQDHSFPKPPFTSSRYYKEYQQALAGK